MGCRKLEPMGAWLKGEGAECRPCIITDGVRKYREALETSGHEDMVGKVRDAVMSDEDPIQKIAAAMDEIKEQVPPEVRAQLESIDCSLQNKEECGACEDL